MQKQGQWLAALSVLWGDSTEPVIMGAAVVVMRVHRTKTMPVSAPLIHFGYRTLVPSAEGENEAILTEIDTTLIQARREASVISWHNGADDLHVLNQMPRPNGAARLPGIEAVTAAWRDRTVREKGVALCVDTGYDLGPFGLISTTAQDHGLVPVPEFLGCQQQDDAQKACDKLVFGAMPETVTEFMAGSALSSALTTALLGGKVTDRLHWDGELHIRDAMEAVAWDVLPNLFGSVRT
ncbi:hypothetical protein [Streptomyces sp. SP18BB07]|uniref:hypothetical protein n=1 Tax=Streptomyces sp. SP18BB07 TaxID=3002522 RepID=UPI002E76290C|nr:hypothetical protein [Streptomyces sp. SP18BB07]MEE1764397.1 hypothetical protein [Streptomyces sp. SP18BB07]